MVDIWFSSDWHFGHKNILNFTAPDGSRLRDFESVEEMNEHIIAKHNQLVKPNDKFYCLGDVAFKLPVMKEILPRLNGHKYLILGNHDHFNVGEYAKYFSKIKESWQPGRKLVFTHRPILLTGAFDRDKVNVHGHTHAEIVPDPRYINVCMETRNYYPVHWDQIISEVEQRGF